MASWLATFIAIALHTTSGVPIHMHPVVALVTGGVEMDVLGLTCKDYSDHEREAVVKLFPRTPQFKEDIIQAFYDGIGSARQRQPNIQTASRRGPALLQDIWLIE